MIHSDQWCRVAYNGGTCTVLLRGELDLLQADELAATLTGVQERAGTTHVRVDLTEVGFIDSTTITALIAGYRAAQATGLAYILVGVRGHVEKVLQISGVLGLLQGYTQRS